MSALRRLTRDEPLPARRALTCLLLVALKGYLWVKDSPRVD